jgi:hypothetical protein
LQLSNYLFFVTNNAEDSNYVFGFSLLSISVRWNARQI